MNKQNDKEILLALQSGNRAVFDALFREYYVPLCRFSNRMICSETLAEEATQNVFISLWKKRKTINIQLSLKAYLYVSTKNATLNMIKKNNTQKQREHTAVTLESTVSDKETSNLNISKFNHFYKQALCKLPEKCREIFLLSRQEGLSYNEIANFLNISPKTVEGQMGIAYKKLRNNLSPNLAQIMSGNQ